MIDYMKSGFDLLLDEKRDKANKKVNNQLPSKINLPEVETAEEFYQFDNEKQNNDSELSKDDLVKPENEINRKTESSIDKREVK